MALVFTKEELGTQSAKGSMAIIDGKKVLLTYNADRLDYVYKQYCERVTACGRNESERIKRKEDSVFKHYLAMLSNNEHTKYKNEICKNKANQK
jgi:hypothetical protein